MGRGRRNPACSETLVGPGQWLQTQDSRGARHPPRAPGWRRRRTCLPVGAPGTRVLGDGWVQVGRPRGRRGEGALQRQGSQQAQAEPPEGPGDLWGSVQQVPEDGARLGGAWAQRGLACVLW